jgi:hypothetical protein
MANKRCLYIKQRQIKGAYISTFKRYFSQSRGSSNQIYVIFHKLAHGHVEFLSKVSLPIRETKKELLKTIIGIQVQRAPIIKSKLQKEPNKLIHQFLTQNNKI